ncbi:MAG: hypothetical protein JXQ76_06585, partial [Campylobacterales bacterium]|nr:hypothetical protein [Campylobacterales bacterium]
MLKKYLILVEGVADMIFFRDYLTFLDSKLKIKIEKINKELILESDDKKITLRIIDGYTKVDKNQEIIRAYNKENAINEGSAIVILVQDADNPLKDKKNGGVINRMKYLNAVQKNSSIQFETFLFPNHNDDGDLETLLLQIAKGDKYNPANDCYSPFVKCLGSISNSVASELAKDKNRIFNYFRAYYGIDSAKEINRVYEEEYWDFSNDALDELLKFMQINSVIPNLIKTKD